MATADNQPQRVWPAALPHTITKPVIVVLMGVSGSGKSTVAALLAAALGCQFQEGDDLHPPENVAKMRGGTPRLMLIECRGSARLLRKSTVGARGANAACSPVRR